MPGTSHLAGDASLQSIINGVYLTHDFSYWTSSRLRQNKFSHIVYVDRKVAKNGNPTAHLEDLDPNEFECLDLNFKSALVLPNLYKSDKFIAKALGNDGTVLVMEPPDTAGANYQKAIAIILGYLMYSFELSFWDAYEALRKIYRTKFELDRFLIMQLYEYEPILEVHRAAEEMGHSRSGERLRSVLKRASCALDASYEETATIDYHHPQSPLVLHSSEDEQEPGDAKDVLLLLSPSNCRRRRSLETIETMIE